MAFVKNIVQAVRKRYLHHHKPASATFGIMFDIDGVIMRGARVLPQAQRAFKLLTDENGFRVPTVILILISKEGGTSEALKLKLHLNSEVYKRENFE